jgi:hypothetical protein
MKKNWIKFKTDVGVEAAYHIDEYGEVSIKIISKVPKRWYASVYNEVSEYYDENIYPTIKIK